MSDQQDHSRYSLLSQKLLDQTISDSERAELFEWLNNYNGRPLEVPGYFAGNQQELKSRILNKITADITASVKKETIPLFKTSRLWLKYAAAVLLLIGVAAIAFIINADRKQNPLNKETIVATSEIIPGAEKAFLTLADGSTISLDSAKQGSLAAQGDAQIIKLDDGQIAYQVGEHAHEKVFMNTMTTPKGGKYQVVLPDGTKVWLNAASSITYPSVFTGKERNTRITGEVYFEVAKNKEKPFIVDVNGQQSIRVLGTHFNVNSYDDEGSIKTTLIEGSVQVFNAAVNAVLIPGQQAIQKDKDHIIVSSGSNVLQVMAWKNGLFDFNDADVETVMRRISRWYDVEVMYEGTVPQHQLVGKLPMNASIEKVMSILDQVGIHCRIEGKKIIVAQ